MNKLHHILQNSNAENIQLQEVKAVREITKNEKKLLYQADSHGNLPIIMAKQKGIKRFEVAIMRQIPFQEYYSDQELKRLLTDYISELSEQYWCAGWYADIEFDLWRLLNTKREEMEPFYQRIVELEDLADLKWLSQTTNGWATWDEELEDIPISLEEWMKLYQEWRERLNNQTNTQ